MQISDDHRWEMLKLALEDHSLFLADDYEMKKDASKVYTYFTMEHYKERYPNDEVYFMLGADLLMSMAKGDWIYGKELIENNHFIVMSRDGIDMQKVIDYLQPHQHMFQLFQKDLDMEISSSYIRNEFNKNESIDHLRYLMPEACFEYILKHKLYQSKFQCKDKYSINYNSEGSKE